MKVNRKCPYCNGPVKVTKTITITNNCYRSKRVQKLLCSSCGATAYGTVEASVEWEGISDHTCN